MTVSFCGFDVCDELWAVDGQYMDPCKLKRLTDRTCKREKWWIARLWMREGIPYFLKDHPIAWEALRTYLAGQLGVSTRDVALVGSAKLGYSLKVEKYAEPYNRRKSDIDLLLVSEKHFQRLVDDAETWLREFDAEIVTPRNKKTRSRWENNQKEVPKHIKRGFVQVDRVPPLDRYETVSKISWLCKEVGIQVQRYADDIPKEVSMRVYKDWKSFEKQNSKTLDLIIKKL